MTTPPILPEPTTGTMRLRDGRVIPCPPAVRPPPKPVTRKPETVVALDAFGGMTLPEEGAYACVNRCGQTMLLPGVCSTCVRREAEANRVELLSRARKSIPWMWQWCRFGAPEMEKRLLGIKDLPPAVQGRAAPAVRATIEQARAIFAEHKLIVFWGDSGVGKTSLASALLDEVIEAGAPLDASPKVVQRARLARFLDMGGISHFETLNREVGDKPDVEDLSFFRKGSSVLLVDNLGRELEGCPPGSPLGSMRIAASRDLVTTRIQEKKPVIITMWMSPEETGRVYGGGFSRMLFEVGPWAIELKRAGGARRP